jgi:hypothetical protein
VSAYTTQAAVQGLIAQPDLYAALDDDGTQINVIPQLNQIIADASNDIDARLANIYQTPFVGTPPAKVSAACLIFVCERIFERRLAPEEKNPWTMQGDMWRKELTMISNDEIALDVNFSRAYAPGAVTLEALSSDCFSG